MLKRILWALALLAAQHLSASAGEREKLSFNADWRLFVGDVAAAAQPDFDDARWQRVTLPYAFNGHEAFRRDIVDLTDTICWYRKHFSLSDEQARGKVFVEFEGARQGADVWVNGHKAGFSDNGVMAFGFDITSYVHAGDNVVAVRCDNSWTYRDRTLNSRYQWNDKNFNANYGGLPKNVWLHLTGKLYQTLPLYSSLGTTGTYVYATGIDVARREATIHVESQVRNEQNKECSVSLAAIVRDVDGREVARFSSQPTSLKPGTTATLTAQQQVGGLHFWSWGYGYLYTVETSLTENSEVRDERLEVRDERYDYSQGEKFSGSSNHTSHLSPLTSHFESSHFDRVVTRTGFRKTDFRDGKFWLNDRCLMVHGYAQRTSNEWPGVGLSVPAWLSDYSNGLIVESGGNLVRWMHVCPWKQDIESCDRVGLLEAMPAGDAEKDVDGARWQQRTQLMRDAIVYNRNNPSIVFYECGNYRISREHMLEMKRIRDEFDPHGGRAIGSREMLDRPEAEYGGEMLYINKSSAKPMWAMEYYRDEGLRKYWDEYSYPYHKEGDGPLYRGAPANDYNHNMDRLACGMVERWHEYWLERPGTGRRVSSGGVKIVFSDTNTHHRGESNYRTSGVVDAMRLPKDAFFAHQVMWDGWVGPERPRTYIIGHWNYDANASRGEGNVNASAVRKPVYVVSTADSVELLVNGHSLGYGRRSHQWLHTFDKVEFEPGTIEARGNDGSTYRIETAGKPAQLRLRAIENPEGTRADGADMVLVEVEVVDSRGRRCPLAGDLVHFAYWGEARWIGGIASSHDRSDNYVGSMSLPVECGVNRILMRTTTHAGEINLSACAEGLKPAYLKLATRPAAAADQLPALTLQPRLTRGETPATPSYNDVRRTAIVKNVKAGSNTDDAQHSIDDNELTEWKSDGQREHAWITYQLDRKTAVSEIALKLTGWRQKCYPLEVYAGKKKVWEGITPATLGYVHIAIDKPVAAKELTIRMVAPVQNSNKFGQVKELAGGVANAMDRVKTEQGKTELRIVEADLLY